MKAVSMISENLGIALLLSVNVISPREFGHRFASLGQRNLSEWETVGGKISTQAIIKKGSSLGFLFGKYKSMNDAITSILMGKLNTPNSWRKFRYGRLHLCTSKGAGVAIQLLRSIKIDAPSSNLT
jgi:hypothetical protein